MEKPLIVIVDTEAQTATLYGAYNVTIPIQDTHILKAYIGDRSVIYVSAAEEADGSEVVDVVTQISEQLEPVAHEPMYIRYTGEDFRRVSDIKLTFAGSKDAKQIDKLGIDVFDRSPLLTKYLLSGEFEILSESDARALRKPRMGLQEAKDKQLDSMILNRKEDVEDIDNIFTEDNDIDADENTEVMTEAEEMVRKRGFGK
jgi:hypothetical protein